MALIQDVVLSANGNLLFSNIPQTYKHLRLYIVARTIFVNRSPVLLQFNNDGGFNYDGLFIQNSSPTVVGANEVIGAQYMTVGLIPGSNATVNYFSTTVVEIGDYTSSTHTKSVTSQSGTIMISVTGNITTFFSSFMWRGIVPITSLTMFSNDIFIAGSRATLYGTE